MVNRELLKVEIDYNNFNKYLDKYGITKVELASVMGVTERTVRRWMVEKCIPLDEMFLFMMEYYPYHYEIESFVVGYVWRHVLSDFVSTLYHYDSKKGANKRDEMRSRAFKAEVKKDCSIEDINLSVRARNTLGRNDITYISQLNGMTVARLTKLKGIGELTAKEIIGKVTQVGFYLESNDHYGSEFDYKYVKTFDWNDSVDIYYGYHLRWRG